MSRVIAVIIVVLAIGSSGCRTRALLKQPVPASQPIGFHDEHTERIADAIRETIRREHIPGISVAVIDHGRMWAQGFGWRDVGRRLPVDTDTQFQAGSISKPVSAPGILFLEASGKVDLDRDVNSYLKGWRLNSEYTNNPVTLRELLCHRAGMVPRSFLGNRIQLELANRAAIRNSPRNQMLSLNAPDFPRACIPQKPMLAGVIISGLL